MKAGLPGSYGHKAKRPSSVGEEKSESGQEASYVEPLRAAMHGRVEVCESRKPQGPRRSILRRAAVSWPGSSCPCEMPCKEDHTCD